MIGAAMNAIPEAFNDYSRAQFEVANAHQRLRVD
jgi:hypothetical protein